MTGCPQCQQNRVPGWQNLDGPCQFHQAVSPVKPTIDDMQAALEKIQAGLGDICISGLDRHELVDTLVKIELIATNAVIGTRQDYYSTLIVQRGDTEAAALLADECRKKDKRIDGLIEANNREVERRRTAEGRIIGAIAEWTEWLFGDGPDDGTIQGRMVATLKGERLKPVHDILTPRPLSDWHEDHGPVLWWRFPIDEPPYVGSPLDLGHSVLLKMPDGNNLVQVGGWPGYHTHWTPIILPQEPENARAPAAS